MHTDVRRYNGQQASQEKKICNLLAKTIDANLKGAENKVWHAHPVWFLDGNPIVGYSKLKDGVRLMFWSGMGFDEPALKPGSGKFKDASILYTGASEVRAGDIQRWLGKAKKIQWDYKNIVKRKGKLIRLAL